MSESKADLVIHPVRFRILQTLMIGDQNTKEIAHQLGDIPASSLYRHLKILLDAGFIRVAEKKLVQGIQEKSYCLVHPPRLEAADLVGVTAEEHLQYFTIYVMTLLQGFADYLVASPEVDFVADQSGYTEAIIWASPQEFEEFVGSVNQLLEPLITKQVDDEKVKHKVAIVTHPILKVREEYE